MPAQNIRMYLTTFVIIQITSLALSCGLVGKSSTECPEYSITGVHIQTPEIMKESTVTLRVAGKAIMFMATHSTQHWDVIRSYRMVTGVTPKRHCR